jgi:hypothetical protein
LACIKYSQFVEFKDAIKEILADDVYCKNMNEEQKKALFGEEFWNHPKDFEFSKGDKVVIAQMREVSKKLLEKMTKEECKQSQLPIIYVSILSKPNYHFCFDCFSIGKLFLCLLMSS